MKQATETLYRRLGYTFNDASLLEMALTHRSVRTDNNERLEFLGDSIVNFIVALELYQRFPKAREGQLSRLRASFVKGETLALLARDLELGNYLRLGPGELKSGGAERASILADVMEAVIGAVYLDSGKNMDLCTERVLHWFGDRLDQTSPETNQKDPKTRLQEYMQSHRLPLPEYEVVETSGEAHDQTFRIACHIEKREEVFYGIGSSRRRAEQEAAEQALNEIEESSDNDDV